MKIMHLSEGADISPRGLSGKLVKVADFKSLSPHLCGLEPHSGHWILHLRMPSSWLTEGRWFYPGARSWRNNAQSGTWGLPPPSMLGVRYITYNCVGAMLNPTKTKKDTCPVGVGSKEDGVGNEAWFKAEIYSHFNKTWYSLYINEKQIWYAV